MADYPHEYQLIVKKFLLVSHTGIEIDIWPQVVEFSFEETMMGRSLHGSVTLVESLDLPTLLPLIGEERLQVSFTRLDEKSGQELDPVQFDLHVYALSNKKQEGRSFKRQTYTLAFCSDLTFKNLNSVVSKPFKAMPYSDMVREIYETHLKIDKDIEIEATDGIMNYTAQNQRAFKTIDQIAKRSKSSDPNNGTFYMFYEDREKFNFVTLKGLLNKGLEDKSSVRTLYYGPKNLPDKDGGPGIGFKDLSLAMYNAEVVEEKNAGFDILHSALSGEGSSAILTVDPIRRSFSFKTLDLRGEEAKQEIEEKIDSPASLEYLPNSDFSSIAGDSAKKPWTNKSKIFINPRANMKIVIGDAGQDTQEYIASRDPQVKPYSPEQFAMQKMAEKNQFVKNHISTTIPGDPRIKLGSVIHFKIPEKAGKVGETNPEELDKYLQGYYVVIGIAHRLTKQAYKMNLELTKPSNFSDIKPRNPLEIYQTVKE
jgi:hypothetical protein